VERRILLHRASGGFSEQMLFYDKKLKGLSQHLRVNMTDAENRLWSKLRRKQLRGHQFYRQKIIGKYIVDFYCPKANLVIELDGGQHYSERGKAKDRDGKDMELFMIYKISPGPSLLKRGKRKGDLC
jgi:very-short-patch-repair endonuclease